MAEPRRPLHFSASAHLWRPRPEVAPGEVLPDDGTDPAPFLPAHFARTELRASLHAASASLARRRGAGLSAGERDLVATAVSRRIGCFFTASAHARRAAQGLRRKREIGVLLEEGLPCPLTGRLGAEIDAAGALTAIPVKTSKKLFWKLEEEKLDDQEIVDLILVAGYANWNARLSLALGEGLRPPVGG